MHTFEVWATRPSTVELVVDARRIGMSRDGSGWWHAHDATAGPGSRYGFSLDDGPPRPDPRSRSQPDGVHGLSQVVDEAAFAWSDGGWRGLPLGGAILYEVHVGTFTNGGTFDAVIDQLPHLVKLGVDAIELMPVNEFPGRRGWGYDGVGLYAPHHAYGGPAGLKRLVDACHAYGLGVVLDVVYNHFGPSGNNLLAFAPYLSDAHRTNWGQAVNFDGPGSDQVRAFVVDNALMWLRDHHIDGLRLDAVHAIVDDSAVHVLEQLAGEVRALAPHVRKPLFVIAESDLNDPRFVHVPQAGGFGLDAAWADEWHHALHAALTGEHTGYYEDFGSIETLVTALRQAWVYDGTFSPHRRRTHGRKPIGLPGRQFVVCTQNHDQVGNRATGNRLATMTSPGRLRVAAALMLTGPFTPMLFQGEEWAATTPFQYFTDHTEPDLAQAVSVGRRNEFASFGWDPAGVPDPQDPATFDRCRLNWDELALDEHAGMLAWYRTLIALRRQWPALADDRLDAQRVDHDDGVVTIERGDVAIVANLSGASRAVTIVGSLEVLAASDAAATLDGSNATVPPDAVMIIRRRPLPAGEPV